MKSIDADEQLDLFEKEETSTSEEETEEVVESEELIMGLYTQEEWKSPVVAGGPTRQEVEEWKKKHGKVYFTPFDGEIFIWRVLKRPEYREIIRQTEITMLDREELITDKIVLFPRDFNIKEYIESGGPAGVPSLLSEMAMDKSGFVAQSAPIKL